MRSVLCAALPGFLLLMAGMAGACGPKVGGSGALVAPESIPAATTPEEAASRPSRPGIFTGCYDSSYGAMLLLENADATVIGAYVKGDGEIAGRVEGESLLFRWRERETGNSGSGYFLVRDDGLRLQGSWGYADAYEGGGIWEAEKFSSDVEECR